MGTYQQKKQEREVVAYQKKINDFAALFQNHQFASQVFYFMQQETMPNVWFKSFNMDRENAIVNLPGESDDADAFSRQVAVFEKNKYVKNINLLNYTIAASSRIAFNLNLALDPKIFSYITGLNPIPQTETQSSESGVQTNPIK